MLVSDGHVRLGSQRKYPRKRHGAQAMDAMATKAFERVNSDVVGHMKAQSSGKLKYFATHLDEFSGYALV